jgi:small subunit ribosomal protein S5
VSHGEGRRSGGDRSDKRGEKKQGDLIDKLVKIRRCACVVKGGRRFSFTAMVVVGNGKGKVGYGYAKANEVPPAVEKATREGSRGMVVVNLTGTSIPHLVEGHFGSAHRHPVAGQSRYRCHRRCQRSRRLRGRRYPRPFCRRASARRIRTTWSKQPLDALKQLRSRQKIERPAGSEPVMNLHEVNKGIKKHKKRNRVGRGSGSGHGKTSDEAIWAKANLAGWTLHPAFEGGQMPLYRRIPKRGFNNRFA